MYESRVSAMLDAQQTVSNEFWVLRSYLRSQGVMTLDLDKHLERMEIVIKAAIRNKTVVPDEKVLG